MINLKRYISIFLLLCFLPVVTPRELIHEFFGHDDTCDVYHPNASIEKLHKHCSIFQFTFSSFVSYLKAISVEKEFDISYYTPSYRSFIPGVSVHISNLRAPPTLV